MVSRSADAAGSGPALDPHWSDRIQRALDHRGQTRTWLAQQLQRPGREEPVSSRSLQYWLNDPEHLPPRWAVSRIAEVLDIDEALLYADLGWLDVHESIVSRDGVQVATKTLQLLRDLAPADGSGCGPVLERAVELGHEAFTWQRLDEFTGEPLRQYIGLSEPGAEVADRQGYPPGESRRRQFADWYERALRRAPALFEDRVEEYQQAQRRCRSEIWVWVPLLMTARAATTPAAPGLQGIGRHFDVVVVVGARGAGADRIGAWLSQELGLGHLNTSLEAQRAYGRSFFSRGDALAHARHCLWVGLACLQTDLGDRCVVSHGSAVTAKDLVRLLPTARGKRVLLVHCDASSGVMSFARDNFYGDFDSLVVKGRDLGPEHHAETRRAVRALSALPDPGPLRAEGPPHVTVVETKVDLVAGPAAAVRQHPTPPRERRHTPADLLRAQHAAFQTLTSHLLDLRLGP